MIGAEIVSTLTSGTTADRPPATARIDSTDQIRRRGLDVTHSRTDGGIQ